MGDIASRRQGELEAVSAALAKVLGEAMGMRGARIGVGTSTPDDAELGGITCPYCRCDRAVPVALVSSEDWPDRVFDVKRCIGCEEMFALLVRRE